MKCLRLAAWNNHVHPSNLVRSMMGDLENPEDVLSLAVCSSYLPQAKESVHSQVGDRGRPKVGIAEGSREWGSEAQTEVSEEKMGDWVEGGEREWGWMALDAGTFPVEEFLMTVVERIPASHVEHHGSRWDQN